LAATKTKGTTGEPVYDPASGACRNVYCHGNFSNGNNYAAKWTGGAVEAKCGSCHGDPATGNPLPKSPHPQMDNCSTCHAGVVDAGRNIIDPSKHINGKLNSFGGERTDW
jgi:predicted CxxxxCH...CXXCH cytochrome family protein